MKLVQLIYASRTSGQANLDIIHDILVKAVPHNQSKGITGFLAFDGSCFLQAIEGGADVVNELFQRISRDPRHGSVRLIGYGEIGLRDFPNWSMGDCDIRGVDASQVLKSLPQGGFAPAELSFESARALLVGLDRIRQSHGERHSL